jgi:hypothetical protein
VSGDNGPWVTPQAQYNNRDATNHAGGTAKLYKPATRLRQLLGEQLDLLDTSMKQEDIHRNDTQKLVVHGRFLEDKFRKDDLLAGVNP